MVNLQIMERKVLLLAVTNFNNLGSNGNVWYGSSVKIQDGGTSNTTSPNSYTTNDVIGIVVILIIKNFTHIKMEHIKVMEQEQVILQLEQMVLLLTLIIMIIGHWMSKDDTNNEATVEFNFGNDI